MPWRVERAGSPGHYTGGWVASNGDLGGVFPTWTAAMSFVGRQLKREEHLSIPEVLERWGVAHTPRERQDGPPRPRSVPGAAASRSTMARSA